MDSVKYSVPGYNIYDGDGIILYDGDIVKMNWGGQGGPPGVRHRFWRFHKLRISRHGRLSISGCANGISGLELIKINPKIDNDYRRVGLDKIWNEYY